VVNLVTVPDVELMKVGSWDVSTGKFDVTPELIGAAIDAHKSGVLRKPVIRLGHNDPRFSGDPAVGFIDNVRASDDGTTLLGDMIGVPEWLGEILPSAYPDRSIEGLYDYAAPDGSEHPFILTGLALLGATPPGVASLKSMQDIQTLYGTDALVDIAAAGRIGGTAIEIAMAAADPKPYGDVKYADEKNGKYPIDTKEHVKAAWDYINMPKNQKGYSSTELADIKAKIKSAATKFGIKIAAAAAETGGGAVTAIFEKVAEALGIDASADEDTIKAKLAELTAPEAEAAEPQPEQVAAAAAQLGLVMVNKEQYDATVAAAAAGQEAREQQIREADEGIVMAAIKDGKIPPARREHWLGALKADREGTKTVLASLAKGLIPLVEAGHGFGTEDVPEVDAGLQRVEDRIFASLGIAKKGTN
jgi:Mu-like prophage I protein